MCRNYASSCEGAYQFKIECQTRTYYRKQKLLYAHAYCQDIKLEYANVTAPKKDHINADKVT